MDTELITKISTERRRYVDYFEKTIEFLKKDKDNYAIELPIQTNSDNDIAPFNIIRVDFIIKNNDYSASELRLDKLPDYPTKTFLYNNIQIDISPFCWNSCEFLVDKIKINDLKEWIVKWQKIDKELDIDTFADAIHSCSEPEIDGDRLFFIVDFGTANETALTDFLEVLRDGGTTKIKIQTSQI